MPKRVTRTEPFKRPDGVSSVDLRALASGRSGAGDGAGSGGRAGKVQADGRMSASRRGYGQAWKRARVGFLAKHPLCAVAAAAGRVEPAMVVDHCYPHLGLKELFWMRSLWLPMSKVAHDGHKARVEARGADAIDAFAVAMGLPTLRALDFELHGRWLAMFEFNRGAR